MIEIIITLSLMICVIWLYWFIKPLKLWKRFKVNYKLFVKNHIIQHRHVDDETF
jgi:hypothetical protein